MKFLSSAYTNPNTNPKTLSVGTLTLNDHHGDFEIFWLLVFYDYIRTIFFRTPKLSDS